MGQITCALVGIALVLSAVFVPMAFFGGSTGVIYRQFSITIVSAMVLSVVVALILTPVLCATLLKPVAQGHSRPAKGLVSGPSSGGLTGSSTVVRALSIPGRAVFWSRKLRYLVIYLLIVVVMGFLFMRMPTAYLPEEDQGILLNQIQLPVGATLERTLTGDRRGATALFPRGPEGGGGILFDRGRDQLFRSGAEQWPGFCQAQGLERCANVRT